MTAGRRGVGSNQYVTRPGGEHKPRTTTRDLAETVAQDPEAVAWAFSPDRAAWVAARVDTYEEMSAWAELPMNASEADTWKTQGFTPDTARPWLSLNACSARLAREWTDLVGSKEMADRWMNGHWDFRETSKWRALGVTDPDVADAWRNANVTPVAAYSWVIEAQIKDPAVVAALVDIGVQPAWIPAVAEQVADRSDPQAWIAALRDSRYLPRLKRPSSAANYPSR